jgi:hypothetical protein
MTDLAVPGDITNPVDSIDLLEQLAERNLERIDDKLRERTAERLRVLRDAEIAKHYQHKATEYYYELWDRCFKSSVSHDYGNLSVRGYTLRVCCTCGHPACPEGAVPSAISIRDTYEQDLVSNLAKTLRKLDEEAGVIEVPKLEDFLDQELGVLKPNNGNGSGSGIIHSLKSRRK